MQVDFFESDFGLSVVAKQGRRRYSYIQATVYIFAPLFQRHGWLPLEFFVAGDELQLFSRKLRGFWTDSSSIQIGHIKVSSSPASDDILNCPVRDIKG